MLVFVKVNGGNSALPYEGQTLHVYNWGEYTGENLLNDFEAKTGAKVVMENFDSNEQMYIKVANGETYDVLVPSDYMIQRLIGENYLQKLDKTKLDCMDKLCEDVVGLPYDPNNDYSIPYFWGTVGIVYDKNQVDIEDLEREGFEIFRDPKYRGNIYLYDSERDSFMTVSYTHLDVYKRQGVSGARRTASGGSGEYRDEAAAEADHRLWREWRDSGCKEMHGQ